MEAEVASLPKAELHCHLDGVPDPAMLRALREHDIELPLTPEALEAAYPVHDFATFLAWFAAQAPLAGWFDLYQQVARLHIERLKAQRVVYAELFVASIPLDHEEALDKMAALRETVNDGTAAKPRWAPQASSLCILHLA